MFVVKTFPLPAAAPPPFAVPAAAAAAPAKAAVAAAKISRAQQAAGASAVRSQTKGALRGLGCACRRSAQRYAPGRSMQGLGALGFNWQQLLLGAGVGAGGDALAQLLGGKKSGEQPGNSSSQITYTGQPSYTPPIPMPQIGFPPPGRPPESMVPPPGYQLDATGRLIPSSASNQPQPTPPSWFGQQTIIGGVPNGLVVGGGAVAALLVTMMIAGRRSSR